MNFSRARFDCCWIHANEEPQKQGVWNSGPICVSRAAAATRNTLYTRSSAVCPTTTQLLADTQSELCFFNANMGTYSLILAVGRCEVRSGCEELCFFAADSGTVLRREQRICGAIRIELLPPVVIPAGFSATTGFPAMGLAWEHYIGWKCMCLGHGHCEHG